MLQIPNIQIPIIEIPFQHNIRLFIKREDLIHPEITGNKYWKLFHNVNQYLEQNPENPLLISFGGAFSNHIAAVAALGMTSFAQAQQYGDGNEVLALSEWNYDELYAQSGFDADRILDMDVDGATEDDIGSVENVLKPRR